VTSGAFAGLVLSMILRPLFRRLFR
jgi:hypothetical protein